MVVFTGTPSNVACKYECNVALTVRINYLPKVARRFPQCFGQPFVKRFALCYQTAVCLSVCSVLSVLSVTLMYCNQSVGCIKMKLGMQVGLDPGHTLFQMGTAPPPSKGSTPNFWPMSIVAKRLDGQRCHLLWS